MSPPAHWSRRGARRLGGFAIAQRSHRTRSRDACHRSEPIQRGGVEEERGSKERSTRWRGDPGGLVAAWRGRRRCIDEVGVERVPHGGGCWSRTACV
eukprot:6186968-Pleurochrysis_carterae.AAC.7